MKKLKYLSTRGREFGLEPVQFDLPSMVTLQIQYCSYESNRPKVQSSHQHYTPALPSRHCER